MATPRRCARAGFAGVALAGLVVAACAANGPRSSTTAAPLTLATGAPTTTAVPITTAPTTTIVTTTIASTTIAPSTVASTAPPPTTVVRDPAAACVAALSNRQLAGLVTWPGVKGDQLVADADVVTGLSLGGVVLMTAPPAGREGDLAALKAVLPRGLLVATDEEGGDVQRLRGYGRLPAARVAGDTMSPADVQAMVAAHGRVIHDLGIDVVFAPVVDVSPVGSLGPLGDRTISEDPAKVTAIAGAYVNGWRAAGILPVLKHFPGHGAASADSHLGAAETPPLDELRTRDLVPYRDLAATGAAVMVGHLLVPGLSTDPSRPADLDPTVVDGLLRRELGFDAPLVFSDSLEMGAVSASWSVPDAAVQSLRAGIDVVIFRNTAQAAPVVDAIEAASDAGTLDRARLEEAAARVVRRLPGAGATSC